MTRSAPSSVRLDTKLFRIQERRDDFPGLLARHDGYDLERHPEPLAVQDPFLKQPGIVAFHQLKAAVKVGLDPAPDIAQPFGKFDSGIAHALVDRDRGTILATLDHHEEHGKPQPLRRKT